MLNTPSNNLVLNDDFLPMVKRLEECLSYLGEHVSGSQLIMADTTSKNLVLTRVIRCSATSKTPSST